MTSSLKALLCLITFSGVAWAATLDQTSPDTTVVKAFNTQVAVGEGSGAQPLDLSLCTPIGGGSEHATFECSKAIASTIGGSHPEIRGPVIGKNTVAAYRRTDGTGGDRLEISQYFCRILEIQTVTKDTALADLEGIGFYYEGAVTFAAKDELVAIGQVRLKNGESATLHRFLAPAFCWRGSITSSSTATYDFKPFAQFRGIDGNTYRNWDLVPQNYELGRVNRNASNNYTGQWIEGFDRTGELLLP